MSGSCFLTAKAEDVYCQYGAVPPAAEAAENAAENAARAPDTICGAYTHPYPWSFIFMDIKAQDAAE